MRVAFLTPEFPSEYSVEGEGLGTYVHRMSKLLIQSGHEAEVFVSSRHSSESLSYDGISVHRVNWEGDRPFLRWLFLPRKKSGRFERWRSLCSWILQARALSAALERRHLDAPFALVQSSDLLAAGLLVRHDQSRVHVVRCSSAADLYNKADGNLTRLQWCRGYLERLSIKRADLAYAPSRYIARYFGDTHGLNVQVIPPPVYLEIKNLQLPKAPLPSRFFLHFGQLTERKGTAILAHALPLAWEEAADLVMVWCGPCADRNKLEYWRSLWGYRANQVHITGPLPKSELYSVLQRADAAVLPSQVDNLPNTAIESLMFGIPVIGSDGASIDELVEEGINGHLVKVGDVDGLARALVAMWKKESPVRKGFEWKTNIVREMQPERAIANLIALTHS
jgi:glycosyltransferase involved in cell wall biosynthesis